MSGFLAVGLCPFEIMDRGADCFAGPLTGTDDIERILLEMPAIVMVWRKGIAQSIPNGILGLEIWWFSIFGSWERWVDG